MFFFENFPKLASFFFLTSTIIIFSGMLNWIISFALSKELLCNYKS